MVCLRSNRRDHRLHQRGVIAWENAEGVTYGVFKPAFPKIEFNMPSLFLGRRLVEAGAERKTASAGLSREVPGLAAREEASWPGASVCAGAASGPAPSSNFFSMRAVGLPPGTQRFVRESATQKDRIGVIFAVVAALTTILLRHRRHHASSEGPSFRKAHALSERKTLIVPGSGAVIPVVQRDFAPKSSPRTSEPGAPTSSRPERDRASSSERSPAKKPSSQSRCSAVNGAPSGMSLALDGDVTLLMPPPPRS